MEPEYSLPCSQHAPLHPILSLLNPIHALPSYFLKVHFNLVLPRTPGLPSGLFPLGVPTKTLYVLFFSPCMPRAPSISPALIWSPEQYLVSSTNIELLIVHLSPASCYSLQLRPNLFPQRPIIRHPQPMFFPQGERPSFTPIKNKKQNYSKKIVYSLFYYTAEAKAKVSGQNNSRHSLKFICTQCAHAGVLFRSLYYKLHCCLPSALPCSLPVQ
jgi:hypothetical protein